MPQEKLSIGDNSLCHYSYPENWDKLNSTQRARYIYLLNRRDIIKKNLKRIKEEKEKAKKKKNAYRYP